MENKMFEREVPDFLKVLCVLSIIGGAFSVIGAIGTMFVSNPNVISAISDVFEQSGQDLPEAFTSSLEHAVATGVILLILSLISITGAIFMLNLKKVGFYMYALSTIAVIFVQPFFNGFDMITVGSMVLSIVWNAIWIITYGLHLKYMK
ncbi:MAG: hypothetical protein WBG43_09700 [Marinifilaceae bacterium]